MTFTSRIVEPMDRSTALILGDPDQQHPHAARQPRAADQGAAAGGDLRAGLGAEQAGVHPRPAGALPHPVPGGGGPPARHPRQGGHGAARFVEIMETLNVVFPSSIL